MTMQEIYAAFADASNQADATLTFVINRGYGFEPDGQLVNGEWTHEPQDFSRAAQRAEQNFGC